MTTPNARIILPAEATGEMLKAARKHLPGGHGQVWVYLPEAYESMLAASPNAGKVTEADLNALAAAIKKASSERRYGKYDYSEYPGKEPPFVVRDERTGDAVFRSWSRDEVEREYARLCDEHIARTAVSALGLEVE